MFVSHPSLFPLARGWPCNHLGWEVSLHGHGKHVLLQVEFKGELKILSSLKLDVFMEEDLY